MDIRVGPRMPGFRTGFPATIPVDVHLYATVMGFQHRPSACSILVRMPEFLRQSAVRAADSHQAISRRDILKWGIASSVLLAALARSVQPLLDQLAWQFFDIGAYFGTDLPMHLELIILMLEYNVLVWVLPLPFAAVTIHALRKPEDSHLSQARAVRCMKISVKFSALCLMVVVTFLFLMPPTKFGGPI